MAFGAEVDKSGFKAGFNAGNFTLVYVGFFLDAGTVLDIQVVKALPVYEGNTQLFWLSCVNKHSFHELSNPKSRDLSGRSRD